MLISMHIQNLDKIYKRVLKILSGNKKNMTNEQTDEQNDRQPKSYIAPLFSKWGYMTEEWTDEQIDRQPKSYIAPIFSKRGYNYIENFCLFVLFCLI